MATFVGRSLDDDTVSALTYEVEKLHHGTPSGIDNTVIVYARPIFFIRGLPIEMLHLGAPFTLVIGDTGIRSPTAAAVADVRRAWTAHPQRYEHLLERVQHISEAARQALRYGDLQPLGGWMDENHAVLQEIGVSCPELDQLVHAARQAGAQGAKLSGGGRGGNMIALANPDDAAGIAQALRQAGAVRTWVTEVDNPPEGQAMAC
jgi:mevalonate kinase